MAYIYSKFEEINFRIEKKTKFFFMANKIYFHKTIPNWK